MVYEPFDVVVVPFPFTDSAQTKRRPALVLSQNTNFGNQNGHSILAMITSQKSRIKINGKMNSLNIISRTKSPATHIVIVSFQSLIAG